MLAIKQQDGSCLFADNWTKILHWSLKLGMERQRKQAGETKGQREGGREQRKEEGKEIGKKERKKVGRIFIILVKFFPGSVRVE